MWKKWIVYPSSRFKFVDVWWCLWEANTFHKDPALHFPSPEEPFINILLPQNTPQISLSINWLVRAMVGVVKLRLNGVNIQWLVEAPGEKLTTSKEYFLDLCVCQCVCALHTWGVFTIFMSLEMKWRMKKSLFALTLQRERELVCRKRQTAITSSFWAVCLLWRSHCQSSSAALIQVCVSVSLKQENPPAFVSIVD